jgi:hypothetical protein
MLRDIGRRRCSLVGIKDESILSSCSNGGIGCRKLANSILAAGVTIFKLSDFAF